MLFLSRRNRAAASASHVLRSRMVDCALRLLACANSRWVHDVCRRYARHRSKTRFPVTVVSQYSVAVLWVSCARSLVVVSLETIRVWEGCLTKDVYLAVV